MSEEYASKRDVDRVEQKVDSMGSSLHTLAGDVRSIRDQLGARDKLENQAQVFAAELKASRDVVAAERANNDQAWTALKTKSLWVAMAILCVATFPNLLAIVKQVRGLLP